MDADIRTFNVVDDFNREALHIEVDPSITSPRLVRVFEQLGGSARSVTGSTRGQRAAVPG